MQPSHWLFTFALTAISSSGLIASSQDGAKRAGDDKPQSRKAGERVKAGEMAPAFTVKGTDGKETTLDALRGEKKDKIVVISFWSHTCPWSRGWDPELSKIAKDYSPKNVVIVAIDSNNEKNSGGDNKDTPEDIIRYHKANSLNFNVYVDPTAAIADLYGGLTTPDVFVIGADGKVHYTGQVNDMGDPNHPEKVNKTYLRDALDAVIGGKEPATTSTKSVGCNIKKGKKAPRQ
ncbi:MAG: redoxin domain-containing protein [Planctomycetes bacterium]|nr:redoxin domain-containing protein [Planctomycetota bacterium]